MVKCVCFDCKSGYKSNREQDKANKIQFFKAPNDSNIIKEWQIAILRDDIKLKPGDAVCSLHFNQEDIIRVKVFRGLDGSVVATSPYIRPHLRKGAVPALKLGRLEKPAPKPHSLTLKRKENGIHRESNICKKMKIEGEVSSIEDDKTEKADPPAGPLDPFALLFKQMFENVNCVRMPISWMRANVTWVNRPGITFFTRIGVRGKNNHVDSICNKEITIDDSMTILIKLNGKSIDHTEFGFETDQLRSAKDVENVIEVLHNREICQGCPDIILNAENSNNLSSFSYMDKVDTLRHKRCPLILSTDQEGKDKEQCKYCKTVKEFLRRKIIHRQHNKTSN